MCQVFSVYYGEKAQKIEINKYLIIWSNLWANLSHIYYDKNTNMNVPFFILTIYFWVVKRTVG